MTLVNDSQELTSNSQFVYNYFEPLTTFVNEKKKEILDGCKSDKEMPFAFRLVRNSLLVV